MKLLYSICLFSWSQLLMGQTWSAVGVVGDQVHCLEDYNDTLFASGIYTTSSQPPFNLIKKQVNNNWVVPPGAQNGTSAADQVRAMIKFQGQMYMGGAFGVISGANMYRNIVKDSAGTYRPLGLGVSLSGHVMDLAVSGGTLFVAGTFSTAGGVAANNISSWNGNSWVQLGSGVDDYVRCLEVFNSELYVGGDFLNAGGQPSRFVAKWNGTSWSSAAQMPGMFGILSDLKVFNNELYAAGMFFISPTSSTTTPVLKWTGSTWVEVGAPSVNIQVGYVMEVHNNELYVTGIGTTTTGLAVNQIAKWNGSAWSALGGGLHGNGSTFGGLAMQSRPDGLYVGGYFNMAGNVPVTSFAKWSTGGGTSIFEERNTDLITVFPNPANESISISIPGGFAEVTICNTMGAQLFHNTITSGEIKIDVSEWSKGLYLLQSSEGGNRTMKKIVIQ